MAPSRRSAVDYLRVLPETLYEQPISPLIYGDFMEPLNDLLPGMWAEKIQDRCFEGVLQPHMLWREDEDWTYPRWRAFACGRPDQVTCPSSSEDLEMVYPRVSLKLDQYGAFVGRQSARVQVQACGQRPFLAGIAQEGISVCRGQALRFEAYLRAHSPSSQQIQVLLGRSYGVFFKTYATLGLPTVGDQWRRFTGTLTPTVSDEAATLVLAIGGAGSFSADKISLMPEDNLCGWRPDVVNAIRDMKPGIIRFGGSSLIYYAWEQGIGPRERRAPFENRPWGNREENDIGLHEFLQFCELVGAEPLVCVNSNSTTVEQILNEIEYCNGPAESSYGRIRAEMGHPAPFQVRYWQIGNEQSGEQYERTMVAYARALRGHYPGLTLLASYPSERILRELSDEVDYVCPHLYQPYTREMEEWVRGLIETIRTSAKNPGLRLGITEWNHTAGHWGWARAWLLTLYNALNAGRMYNMYHRLGERIRIANRSNMTNSSCSGVIQTNRSGDIYFTPCYYVQRAYANLTGDQALRLVARPDDPLDVSATRRRSDGEVVLSVVNCLSAAQLRRIELADLGVRENVSQVWTLAGPAPDAVNSFEDKHCVAPQEATAELKGGSFCYEFSPFSVTILRCR